MILTRRSTNLDQKLPIFYLNKIIFARNRCLSGVVPRWHLSIALDALNLRKLALKFVFFVSSYHFNYLFVNIKMIINIANEKIFCLRTAYDCSSYFQRSWLWVYVSTWSGCTQEWSKLCAEVHLRIRVTFFLPLEEKFNDLTHFSNCLSLQYRWWLHSLLKLHPTWMASLTSGSEGRNDLGSCMKRFRYSESFRYGMLLRTEAFRKRRKIWSPCSNTGKATVDAFSDILHEGVEITFFVLITNLNI